MTRRLLLGVLLGPVAWLAGLELLFALVSLTCRYPAARAGFVLPAVGIATMLVSVVATVVAWRAWRAVQPTEGEFAERVRFMALTGVGSGLLFALVVVAGTIPTLMLGSCE